jgi:hypothetical protein
MLRAFGLKPQAEKMTIAWPGSASSRNHSRVVSETFPGLPLTPARTVVPLRTKVVEPRTFSQMKSLFP